MTDPMRARALARLREGRVMIRGAITQAGEIKPSRILALVRSSREGQAPYVVELDPDRDWECTCRPGLKGEDCPHVHAVKLVTGYAP